MLIVGYPISYETACKMFGVEKEYHTRTLETVVEKKGLEFHWIDKGVCILGLEIKEVAKLWEFTSVDESIGLIMAHKMKFVELIGKAGLDISEVLIERIESEPLLVKNPPPYLMTV